MDIHWRGCHNGIYRAPYNFQVLDDLMPNVLEPLRELMPLLNLKNKYTVDVKVHMLMPGQYPCIPNWHYDMVPRDSDGKQDFSKVTDEKMWLWVSGAPLTEFENIEVKEKTWTSFTQRDKHRGVASKEHTWRGFIRVCPSSLLPVAEEREWLRRHSQVYLDSNNFTW